MRRADKQRFNQLKAAISIQLRLQHPEVPENLAEWRGSEIQLFQEDLLAKVSGRISEKWFYTHIKSTHDVLPRIDMLDLLSKYAGYKNWNDFSTRHSSGKKQKTLLAFAVTLPLIAGGIVLFQQLMGPVTYTFCFTNAYSRSPVSDVTLDVIILEKNQSPLYLQAKEGCFTWEGHDDLRFVVRSPYYVTDTFYRVADRKTHRETVGLQPDDYAQVIHLLSNASVSEWKNRKADLESMFHDHARIYQVFDDNSKALAIYNKEEFIRKLMLPTQALKNLEIVDTQYTGAKIEILRFKQADHDL